MATVFTTKPGHSLKCMGHVCPRLDPIGIMCSLRTPRPICRSTSRPPDRSTVGRHIDRCSTDMSVDISTDSRPMCRSRCVGRHVDRHIGRYLDRYVGRYVDRHISIDTSAECWSTCRWIGNRHSADIYVTATCVLVTVA